jgi:hypothetical protein
VSWKLALALLALVAACGGKPGASGLTPSRAPIAHTRIGAGPADQVVNSDFETPANLLITDAAEWRSVWEKLHAGLTPLPPAPAVDFTQEAVVLVAIGQQPNGGHSVRIDSVNRAGSDSIVVRATHRIPGPDCITTQALVEPVDLARIPRPSGPVGFVVQVATYPCES